MEKLKITFTLLLVTLIFGFTTDNKKNPVTAYFENVEGELPQFGITVEETMTFLNNSGRYNNIKRGEYTLSENLSMPYILCRRQLTICEMISNTPMIFNFTFDPIGKKLNSVTGQARFDDNNNDHLKTLFESHMMIFNNHYKLGIIEKAWVGSIEVPGETMYLYKTGGVQYHYPICRGGNYINRNSISS